MPDEILTLPEVAILLKVAEKTVYTMAQKAQLPAFKVRESGGSSVSISIGGSSNRRPRLETREEAECLRPSHRRSRKCCHEQGVPITSSCWRSDLPEQEKQRC